MVNGDSNSEFQLGRDEAYKLLYLVLLFIFLLSASYFHLV